MNPQAKVSRENRQVLLPILTNLSTDYRCYKMAKSLENLGYEPVILCEKPFTPLGEIWNGLHVKIICPISHMESLKLAYLIFSFKLMMYLATTKSKIWIVEDYPPLFITALLGKLKRANVIYDSHELALETSVAKKNFLEKNFWKFTVNMGLKWVQKIIVVSPLFEEYYQKFLNAKKYALIPNYPYKHNLQNQKNNLDDNPLHFLFIGHLRQKINLDVLLEAVQTLPFQFTIIGNGVSRKKLESLAKDLGVSDKVYFTKTIAFDKLLEYGDKCNIGVFLEKSEEGNTDLTWSNKVFDYIQRGLPVLMSDTTANKILNEKYAIGEIVNPTSLEDVKNTVEKISKNYALYYENCLKARELLIWEKNEQVLADFLNN